MKVKELIAKLMTLDSERELGFGLWLEILNRLEE